MVHRPGGGIPESPGRVSVMTPRSSPADGTVTERATGTEPGAVTITVAGPAWATGTPKEPSASTAARPSWAPVGPTSVTVAGSAGQPSRPWTAPVTRCGARS